MLLGIAPFDAIHGSNDIDLKEQWLTTHEYQMGKGKEELSMSLEPNHTHFILMDGGFGEEIKTRNLIEEAICRDEHYVHSPMVLLVVGGGFGTLKTVRSALEVEAGAAARVGGRSGRSGWPHHRPA